MIWIMNNWRSLALVVLASLIAAIAYQAGADHVQKLWDKEKAIQTMEIIKSNAISAFIQIGLNLKFTNALEDFERDKIISQNEIDNANAANQRLQDRINTNQNRVPKPTETDSGNAGAASPAWALFAECASEVTWMGAEADRLRDRAELGRRYAEIASDSIAATEIINKRD